MGLRSGKRGHFPALDTLEISMPSVEGLEQWLMLINASLSHCLLGTLLPSSVHVLLSQVI